MFVAAHEWTLPGDAATGPAGSPRRMAAPNDHDRTRQLYDRLAGGLLDDTARNDAIAFVRQALHDTQGDESGLPESPGELANWMHDSAQRAGASYRDYLEARKAGAPRRYFQNRAHALYFLRAVAPTKLVDGAWLYGLLAHAHNPRFTDLIATYVEELGEGRADKNHVLLYRQLLERHGLNPLHGLPDAFYTQGVLQLALGGNADEFLPEIIGFNLGYEQLPLHLLITAYELNELGVDPYYFTLHITVDNADSGHAQRAVQAVHDTLTRFGDSADFWRRVQGGCKLSNAGVGTTEVIAGFDIQREVENILSRKRMSGQGAHSDYCRVAGRSVNDWLARPDGIPAFLAALEQAGWIKRHAPAQESRFWKLLQGDRAEMFGVFSPYEVQVIHDWIRGDASADGQAHNEAAMPPGRRRASFRAQSRLKQHQASASNPGQLKVLDNLHDEAPDPDLQALKAGLAASVDARQHRQLLVRAMSPDLHWTPAGLYATRRFMQLAA
ncbi:iron-containing redox enzyme family protein [Polaromonas glacialis]|uniref:iron-containing redox enzyme family protein n=1 Tax=Polaromonas glacialis TaxID=866564 RepID=UPI00049635F9|nr:iron-containing redox enzyme family protein [Polaromonas glacialis]